MLHVGKRLTRELAKDVLPAWHITPPEDRQIEIVAGALDDALHRLGPFGILTVKHLGYAPGAGVTIGNTLIEGLGEERLQGAVAVI